MPFALLYVFFKISHGDVKTSMVWVVLTGLCFFFAGAAMGGINVLQSVMIADAVDYEEYHKGYRPDGVFFSGQSFITKLSAGISSIIQGVGYSIVGFSGDNVSACNEALRAGASFKDQFPQYAGMMFFLCSIPPAIGLFLTDEEHRTILEALVQRRNAQAEEIADN